jgi:hypothetical protein
VIAVLLLWPCCGVFGWYIGKLNGRGDTGLVLGLLLGPVGVIAAVFLTGVGMITMSGSVLVLLAVAAATVAVYWLVYTVLDAIYDLVTGWWSRR